MTNYVLLERKDRRGNTIYALPNEHYHNSVTRVLNSVGHLSIDDPRILGTDVQITVQGSLAQPSRTSRNGVEDLFKEMAKCGVDSSALIEDPTFVDQVLRYTMADGDLTFVDFNVSKRRGNNTDYHLKKFVLSDYHEGEVSVREDGLYLGRDRIQLFSEEFVGEYLLQKVGRLNCHRLTLEPQSKQGEVGFGAPPRMIIKRGPFDPRTLKDFEG